MNAIEIFQDSPASVVATIHLSQLDLLNRAPRAWSAYVMNTVRAKFNTAAIDIVYQLHYQEQFLTTADDNLSWSRSWTSVLIEQFFSLACRREAFPPK